MRPLLAATLLCLTTANAGAEILRVEFEGRLTTVDDGFPIPLAEDETIRGHYLIDTGSYLHSEGDLLGESFIQPIRGLSLAGSSGWQRHGIGQLAFFGGEFIPGAINRPLFSRPHGSGFVRLLANQPIDFTDLTELGRIISSQLPGATFATFEESVDIFQDPQQAAQVMRDRFFITPLFINPFVGFTPFESNAPTNRHGNVALGFTGLSRPSDQPLNPPLAQALTIQIPVEGTGGDNEIAAASFSIDQVAVVPEPATIGIAAVCALAGLRRRRSR